MNIHEYQAKELLARHGATVMPGALAHRVEEAKAWAEKNPATVWAVKAQIHAGGRGKGGGVKLARNLDELQQHAQSILGMQLVTKQTGPEGQKVHKLWIEEGCAIEHEYYVSLVVDRERSCVSFVASREGGMDIEEVAAKHPERIYSVPVDPLLGPLDFELRRLAWDLGFEGPVFKKAVHLFGVLHRVFCQYDCSLLELNPLVSTKGGTDLVVLDAKMGFDANALYRQPDIVNLRDEEQEDPLELEASRHGLEWVKLDGSIGCMVNGAGLAMATMDIIKLCGMSPANFLDVGGGASKDKVREAFKILTSDPRVRVILVNIFGGIMKCSVIAEGIVEATREVGLKHPLVVRLEGTQVEEGRAILQKESTLHITLAKNLDDAARHAVELAAK